MALSGTSSNRVTQRYSVTALYSMVGVADTEIEDQLSRCALMQYLLFEGSSLIVLVLGPQLRRDLEISRRKYPHSRRRTLYWNAMFATWTAE